MIALPSSVRKLRIAVRCDSAANAMALRASMGDYNRSRLIPVMERVLAEASRPGTRIRLDRLHVNLGVFSPEEVETLASARLYEALTEALRDALRDIGSHTAAPGDGWLSLLEIYLLTGRLPFWAPHADSFSPSDLFTELAERQAVALSALFRRIGRDDNALDRTAHQLLPDQLCMLVRLLEPDEGELILSYRADVAATHRVERITDLADARFSHLLWLLVLTYLLRDPGSQFNRKAFVRSLLTGIADHAGVSYADILGVLARALRMMSGHAGLRSSLPAIVGELADDSNSSPTAPAAAEDGVAGDRIPALLRLLFPDLPPHVSPPAFAAHLRSLRHDRAALERAVRRLLPEEFRTVIRLLEPVHAQLVLGYMEDVTAIHHSERLARPGENGFEFLLRQLVLSYLLREPGSQFNRKAFVNSLIAGLAAHNGLSFPQILDLLGKGLRAAQDPRVLRSSLPGIIQELLREAGRVPADGIRDDAEPRHTLSRLVPDLDNPATPVAQALKTALAQVSDSRALLSRVIAAVRQEQVLDFEKLVVETNSGQAGAVSDSIESLQAALLAAIASPTGTPDSAYALLRDLLRRDLRAGRLFLRAQMNQAPQREALLWCLPPARFEALLELLLEGPSASLSVLITACRQLPLADRPTFDTMHAAILTEVLRRDPVDEANAEFFPGIVGAIFPVPLPKRIRRALARRIPASEAILRSILNADRGVPRDREALPDTGMSSELMVDRIFEGNAPDLVPGFLRALAAASDSRAADVRQALRRRLARRADREYLFQTLSSAALAELVEVLDPNAGNTLLAGAALFASAATLSLPGNPSAVSAFHWNAVLEVVAATGISRTDMLVLLLDKCLETLSLYRGHADSVASGTEDTVSFLRHASRLAAAAGARELLSALATRDTPSADSGSPIEPAHQARPLRRVAPPSLPVPRRSRADAVPEGNEPLFVPNAGLVLASPFLPHLFDRLEMLEKTATGRSRWRDPHTASRAVHLLQYLVDGRISAPEPRLVWNKILCGLPPSTPIERAIEPSSRELAACDELLAAVLANWSALSKTSVGALRETFLQRQGKVERTGERCALHVQRKTVDVLLDRIGWSFRFVFHGWMQEPVYVTW